MVDDIKKQAYQHWLDKERKPVMCLGQGYHKNQLYYGSTIENPNREVLDCVVTSNRDIYVDETKFGKSDNKTSINHIREDFGLNYRFRFFEEVLDFTWSRASIKKYLMKNYEVDIKQIFEKLVDINSKFMVYENPTTHKFIALDIMKTFWYQLFPANGRTFFNADKDSGKTNQLMIYKAFSFNPTASPDFSGASIYRIIESTCATILFDDFDELPDKQKSAVIRHIRVNYKKFKTLRADGGRSFKPQAYNSFSHLIFNNVLGLGNDFITLSRVITIKLLQSPDARELQFNADSKEWQPLRDDLYCMGLQYFKEVMDNYHKIKVPELKTRNLEIFKPILAIAKIISDDLYDEVLQWYIQLKKDESIRDVSEDWEYLMLKQLWELFKDDDKTRKITSSQITKLVSDVLNYDDLSGKEKNRKIRNLGINLGKKLSGYVIFKKTRIDGYPNYEINRDGLKRIIKKQGFEDDIIKEQNNKKVPKKVFEENYEQDVDWDGLQ